MQHEFSKVFAIFKTNKTKMHLTFLHLLHQVQAQRILLVGVLPYFFQLKRISLCDAIVLLCRKCLETIAYKVRFLNRGHKAFLRATSISFHHGGIILFLKCDNILTVNQQKKK